MSVWIAISIAALLAAAWLARPFLARAGVESTEAEHAISIYRDQQDELRRDARSGLISESERDAAEQEIERRALRAARLLDAGVSVARRSPATAGLVGLLALATSLGLYAELGTPEALDQPLAARREALLQRRAEAGDLESRAMLLVERTRENPERFEDWWLLARSYAALGDHASAADAYRRAAALSDDDPAVLSAYAEAMTLANGNKVPAAAKLVFAQVRDANGDPRARYYLALARAQEQDFEGALADWLGLYRESTAEAPWLPIVRRDIVNMARFLQRDLRSLLPDASEAELAKAGAPPDGAARPARAEASGPAETLAAALAENPKDWQGWLRLARLHVEQGAPERARAAIEAGREHYAGAPFVLAKLEETAQELGLSEGAPAAAAPRGPSEAEVAAAVEMSEADRDDMIRGMVEGLASRLEAQSDDIEGWLMLIRSYAVLQDPDAARGAVQRATTVFAAAPSEREQIIRLAETLGLAP